MFAYCGLVGNPHLTAKVSFVVPLPTSTKNWFGVKSIASLREIPTGRAFQIRGELLGAFSRAEVL